MSGDLKQSGKLSVERLNGMLDMGRALIRLPVKLISADDPERKAVMEAAINKDIDGVYAGIVKDRL